MMFNKILVAMDNSPMGETVLNQALSLGKATGAKLFLLHVLSPEEEVYLEMPGYTGFYPMEDYQPYFDIYVERLKAFEKRDIDLLRSRAKQATDAGVDAEYRLILGHPGRSICNLARSWDADLIVIGSRGRSGLKELVLGSVSNYVTHHAPCSVMVIHDQINTNASSAQKEAVEATP